MSFSWDIWWNLAYPLIVNRVRLSAPLTVKMLTLTVRPSVRCVPNTHNPMTSQPSRAPNCNCNCKCSVSKCLFCWTTFLGIIQRLNWKKNNLLSWVLQLNQLFNGGDVNCWMFSNTLPIIQISNMGYSLQNKTYLTGEYAGVNWQCFAKNITIMAINVGAITDLKLFGRCIYIYIYIYMVEWAELWERNNFTYLNWRFPLGYGYDWVVTIQNMW